LSKATGLKGDVDMRANKIMSINSGADKAIIAWFIQCLEYLYTDSKTSSIATKRFPMAEETL